MEQARGRHGPLESLLERAARERREDPYGPERPGPGPEQSVAELADLIEVHLRLLASSEELLEAYLDLLDTLRHPESPPREPGATVDVGPFATLGSVRAFEAALATLPGVVDVGVRGYERGDRAIIEVELSKPVVREE